MKLFERCVFLSLICRVLLWMSTPIACAKRQKQLIIVIPLLCLLVFCVPQIVKAQIPVDISSKEDVASSLAVRKAPLVWENIEYIGKPWVQPISRIYTPTAGLNGRHLFVWPSHGRYFNAERWAWQRPILFCTTEDLLTPSFVFTYLNTML